jgi:hypothetical protein
MQAASRGILLDREALIWAGDDDIDVAGGPAVPESAVNSQELVRSSGTPLYLYPSTEYANSGTVSTK